MSRDRDSRVWNKGFGHTKSARFRITLPLSLILTNYMKEKIPIFLDDEGGKFILCLKVKSEMVSTQPNVPNELALV